MKKRRASKAKKLAKDKLSSDELQEHKAKIKKTFRTGVIAGSLE